MSERRRVVCLHGIWMPGAGMLFIKRRLEADGDFAAELFNFSPVRETLDGVAGKLADRLSAGSPAHIVGYSLGGVVALRMLALRPETAAGRVVCIGSPLSGSRAAHRLSRLDWGRAALGRTVADSILGTAPDRWARGVTATHEVGSIAGDVPIGFGRFIAGFDEANDGTVAVSETRMPGMKDHIVLPVSHKGMLISRDVAEQTAAFLRRGEFLREP